MVVELHTVQHLVKSEDLNHHGTLFAGRAAEWFVESGFIAAASLTHPENIVCLKIHGMTFSRPVQTGEIITFESRVVHGGRSTLVAFVRVHSRDGEVLRGFLTFVHVDEHGRSVPHGLTISPVNQEEQVLQEEAAGLNA